MNRSIIILSTVWVGLCLAIVISVALPDGVFPLDECSAMPTYQMANCRHMQENSFPRPFLNHPYLQGYPDKMLDENGKWRPSLADALSGPQRIHLPYMALSIELGEGERAFANENAKWMSGKLSTRCDVASPEAAIFSRTNDNRTIVSFYNYEENWPNDRNPTLSELHWKIDLPEEPEIITNILASRIKYKNTKSAEAGLDQLNRMRRHEIKFVNEPRSLKKETGIPQIVTYAYQVNWFNRKTNELEITATKTEILFPYKNGTAHFSALITTLDGISPAPVPWQHLWRDIQFEGGLPDNRPKKNPDRTKEPRNDLGSFFSYITQCEVIDALPEDWEWPKGYPRHWWSLESWAP